MTNPLKSLPAGLLAGCAMVHPAAYEAEPAEAASTDDRAAAPVADPTLERIRSAVPAHAIGTLITVCSALGCASTHPLDPGGEPLDPEPRSVVGSEWSHVDYGCAGNYWTRLTFHDDGTLSVVSESEDFDGAVFESSEGAGEWSLEGEHAVRWSWQHASGYDFEDVRTLAVVDAEPFGGEGRWWSQSAYVATEDGYLRVSPGAQTVVRFDRAPETEGPCAATMHVAVATADAVGTEELTVACAVSDLGDGLMTISFDEAPYPEHADSRVASALSAARVRGTLRLDPAQPDVLVTGSASPGFEGYTRP